MMLAAMLATLVLAGAAPALAQQGSADPADGPAANGESFTVNDGDTLRGIAGRLYGDMERWEPLLEANREQIGDPDLIFPGQVLLVPGDEEAPAPTATAPPEPAVPEPTATEGAVDGDTAEGAAGIEEASGTAGATPTSTSSRRAPPDRRSRRSSSTTPPRPRSPSPRKSPPRAG